MDFNLQIRMNISAEAIGRLPENPCPQGYRLRTLRPVDEVNLPGLMVSAAVGWTPFDATRMAEYLAAPDRRDGSHVVEANWRRCASPRGGMTSFPRGDSSTMYAFDRVTGAPDSGFSCARRCFDTNAVAAIPQRR